MMNQSRNIIQNIRLISIFCIFSFIAIFTYIKTHDLFFGTNLSIVEPADGQIINTALTKITGKVGVVAKMSLNGESILADESGQFNYTRALVPGYNIIEVRALDKFNREMVRTVRVVYEPQKQGVLTALSGNK